MPGVGHLVPITLSKEEGSNYDTYEKNDISPEISLIKSRGSEILLWYREHTSM